MNKFLLLGILATIATSFSIGEKDADIDPGTITWPKDSFKAPIEMSKVNKDQTAEITFNFNPSTTIKGGVVEIHFPSTGFDTSSSNGCSSGICTISEDLTSGTDASVTVSTVTLNTEGIHGPFKIVTRESSSGQIVDANYVFASAAIAPAIPSAASLTVGIDTTSDVTVLSGSNTISLTFNLGSTDLWKDDIIIVETPESTGTWTDKADPWKLTGTVSCVAKDPSASVSNKLFGADGKTTTLSCYENADNNIVIYGFGKDILGGGQVKIDIGKFTPPGAVYASSSFTWNVKIYSHQTENQKLNYQGTGPNPTLVAEAVTISSWAKANSFVDVVVADMPFHTSLKFTVGQPVPKNGEITVAYSGVTTTANPLAFSSDAKITFSETTGTVTIDVTEGFSSGTFEVLIYGTLSSSAKVSITVKDATGGNKIAEKTNHAFTLDTSGTYTRRDLAIANEDGVTFGDIGGTKKFTFTVTGKAKLTASESIEIKCPFVDSATTIPALKSIAMETGDIFTVVGEDDAGGSGVATASDLTAASGFSNGKISLEVQAVAVGADNGGSPHPVNANGDIIFTATSSAASKIALPLVNTNGATLYECFFKSSSNEVGSVKFDVTAKSPVQGASQDVYSAYSCLADTTTTTANLPYALVIPQAAMPTTIDNTYKIEVTYSTNIGLENDEIANLPIYSSQNTNDATASLSGGKIVTISKVAIAADTEILIPANQATAPTATISIYKEDSTYSSVKNEVFKGTIDFGDNAATATSGTGTAFGTGNLVASKKVSVTTDAQTFAAEYAIISARKGYDLSGVTSSPGTKILSYNDAEVSMIVLNGLTAGSLQLALSNIQTPPTTTYGGDDEIYVFNNAADIGAGCTLSGKYDVTLGTGAITSISVSPNSFKTKNIDNLDTSITVSFTIASAIPEGGQIIVDLESGYDLTAPAFTCTVSGVTKGTCAGAANGVATISGVTADAGSSVSVTLNNVILPGSTASAAEILESITTKGLASDGTNLQNIDTEATDSNLPNVDITAASSVTAGTSSIGTFSPYPNAAGATNADLYLEATFTKKLLKGSVVEVSAGSGASFGATLTKDHCWSNVKFSACSISSGKVSFTVDEEVGSGVTWKLYVDDIYNLPSSDGQQEKASIKVTYSSETIIQDTADSITKYEVKPAAAGTLTAKSAAVDTSNVGQHATYTFTVTPSVAIATTDEIYIDFPQASFDPLVAAADKVDNCGDNEKLFIACKVAGTTEQCRSDHWTVVVSPSTEVAKDTDVAIEISNVFNPVATGEISGFSMHVKNSDGNFTMSQSDLGKVTLTALPGLVKVKEVAASTQTTREKATLTVEFIITNDIADTDNLHVHFPHPFELQLDGLSGATSCITYYYDSDSTLEDKWAQITNNDCTVSGQVATQVLAKHTTTEGTWLKVDISGVPLPSWGYTRSATKDTFVIGEIDLVRTADYGTYDLWTKDLMISITDANSEVTYKSNPTLDNAYIGLKKAGEGATSGSYDPKTKTGGIDVEIGTQFQNVELNVDGNWLEAKKLKYKADGGDLKVTSSFNDFTLYQGKKSIKYSVAAPSSLASGQYYINWSIEEEEKQSGVSDNKYEPPVRTLVNVCPPKSKNTLTVTTPEDFYKGKKSVPIKVQAPKAPASDISVAITSSSEDVTVNPATLTFGPGQHISYFEVTVSSNFNLTSGPVDMTFSLSGTDSAAFEAPSKQTITIQEAPGSPSTPVVTVTGSSSARNTGSASFSVSGTNDAGAVVYYYLACKGRKELTYDELVNKVKSLVPVDGDQGTNVEMQLQEEYQNYETDPDAEKGDNDYLDFIKRKEAEHCSKEYVGAQVVYSSESVSQTFERLLPGQQYNVYAFASNGLIDTSALVNVTTDFTTDSPPDSQRVTVAITKATKLTQETSATITEVLAKYMGVNPQWLYQKGSVQSTNDGRVTSSNGGRRLRTTSTFNYETLYDPFIGSVEPTDFANRAVKSKAQIEKELVYSGIINSSDTLDSVISNPVSSGNSFTTTPTQSSVGNTSAEFNFTTANDGYVHVSCASTKSPTITIDQINSGLDAENNSVPNGSSQASEGTVSVHSLIAGNTYYCYFSVCGESLMNSICAPPDAVEGFPQVKVTTSSLSGIGEDDNAEAVQLKDCTIGAFPYYLQSVYLIMCFACMLIAAKLKTRKSEYEADSVPTTKLMLRNHLTLGLLYYTKDSWPKRRILSLGVILILENLTNGLALFLLEDTKKAISVDFEPKFILHIILGMVMALPVDLVLVYLLSKSIKHQSNHVIWGLIMACIVILVSLVLTIFLVGAGFCSQWSEVWLTITLISVPLEVFGVQTILMLVKLFYAKLK